MFWQDDHLNNISYSDFSLHKIHSMNRYPLKSNLISDIFGLHWKWVYSRALKQWWRQRQCQKTMIWLVERGQIVVLHERHALEHFLWPSLPNNIRELKQPGQGRQQNPHKFAHLTMKNSIFARFARAFFIFWHFEDVVVLSSTWNDLFCSCVGDESIW